MGIIAALLLVAEAAGANPYTGTYAGGFSSPGDTGGFMTFVATNGVGITVGYSSVGRIGFYLPTFTVSAGGAFSASTLAGTHVAGQISSGTVSGTYSNGAKGGAFVGSLKNNTGTQQTIAGVYTGSFTGVGTFGDITTGTAVGILAADGTFFFYTIGTLGEDGGSGALNGKNQMVSFISVNGLSANCSVSAATDTWSGNWAETVTLGPLPFNLTGTYSLSRSTYLPLGSFPVIATAATLPAGFVGVAYSQMLQAVGGTPPYNWSVSSGSLPVGLTLSSVGVISGIPSATGSGTLTITCTGTDSLDSAKAFSLKITPIATVATPTITSNGGTFSNSVTVILGCGTAGATIRYTVDGTAPTSSSTVYKQTGLLLTNSVTLTVQAFKTKLVNSAVAAAAFTIIPPAPLTISTTSLPDGIHQLKYTEPLVATGGVTPYKWSLAAGKLPPGLTLNATTGIIAGKPTQATTAPVGFTVKVTDARKQTGTQPLTLTVN